MTVFHQIEKRFRNDCVPPHLEMTVFHLIIKWYGIKEKSKTFVHYENKYITYIKHKQNCIVPCTEIKPTTTTTTTTTMTWNDKPGG